MQRSMQTNNNRFLPRERNKTKSKKHCTMDIPKASDSRLHGVAISRGQLFKVIFIFRLK